jgi:4-diphosphocytidyl-2-C-methyl-D-erythritol kinase
MTAADGAFDWPAPAKLNLFLHVTGRRADGYHELQTAFQFLDYGDRLRFEPAPRDTFELHGGLAGIDPEQDLIMRAARLLAARAGGRTGVRIRVEKRLPPGGGLGGGSSDAATTLLALNELWGLGLDSGALMQAGLALGADVPVFVRGRAAWAEGVGEQLTPLEGLAEPWYVVVYPAVSVSTAEIFSDPQLTRDAPRIKIADFLPDTVVNHLQAVVVRRYPEVAKALNWLSKHRPARMTGSGSCVFAACEDRHQAQRIVQQVPAPWSGFVARGCNRSPLLEALQRCRD